MKKNRSTEGVQYRYVPRPEELRRLTVFGTNEVIQVKCTKCGESKNLTEFYWVRGVRKSWCTVCHNKDTKKRSKEVGYRRVSYKLKKEIERQQEVNDSTLRREETNTLERFFA